MVVLPSQEDAFAASTAPGSNLSLYGPVPAADRPDAVKVGVKRERDEDGPDCRGFSGCGPV